jgi:hypothetical protein
MANGAVGHGGRAVSDGVNLGGIHSAGGQNGSLGGLSRSLGGCRLMRLRDGAHGSIERDSLGRNVADRAVGHGRRTLGDRVDRGGVDGARGERHRLGGGSRRVGPV